MIGPPMKFFYSIFLFYIVLLSGCSSISTPGAAPIQPTQTLPPTSTSIEATETPHPDLSATAFAVTSTAIVKAVMTVQQSREYRSYTSPDGNWQARVVIYDCIKVDPRAGTDSNSMEQLRMLETSSGQERVSDSQLLYCGGLGAYGLEGLAWSANSRYFYYTNAREGFPDGCPGNWERPVLRMETDTLKAEDLGRGSLSPDGTKLATWQANELVLWDVNAGVETGRISAAIPTTEMEAGGPIVWSPDSQALIYIQAGSYCQPSTNSAVVHLDLQTLEQEILLESKSPTFRSARWEEINELTLFDENQIPWVYHFNTRELEQSF
jgi:hypothetical protein